MKEKTKQKLEALLSEALDPNTPGSRLEQMWKETKSPQIRRAIVTNSNVPMSFLASKCIIGSMATTIMENPNIKLLELFDSLKSAKAFSDAQLECFKLLSLLKNTPEKFSPDFLACNKFFLGLFTGAPEFIRPVVRKIVLDENTPIESRNLFVTYYYNQNKMAHNSWTKRSSKALPSEKVYREIHMLLVRKNVRDKFIESALEHKIQWAKRLENAPGVSFALQVASI